MVVSKIQANGPNQKKALVTRVIDLFTDRVHLAKLLKNTNPAYMPLEVQTIANELIGDLKIDYPLVSLKDVKKIADLRCRYGIPGIPFRGRFQDIFTIDSPLNADIHFRVKDPTDSKKWYTVDLKVFYGSSFESLEEKREVFKLCRILRFKFTIFLSMVLNTGSQI